MKQSSTGYGSAVIRAMENLLPEDTRLFEDPYSEKFLSPFYQLFLFSVEVPHLDIKRNNLRTFL